MERDLICIICPRGCHLHVDDNLNVTGNLPSRTGLRKARTHQSYPHHHLDGEMRFQSLAGLPRQDEKPDSEGKNLRRDGRNQPLRRQGTSSYRRRRRLEFGGNGL